jgi:hypothetical protein
MAWNTQPIEGRGFRVTGTLRILPGGRGQMNFLFARHDGGFYSIAFVADWGFTVFDYRSAGDECIKVGEGPAPGLRLGVSSAVVIEVEGNNLTVQLDDLSWNIELPTALPPKMVWGLGAQAGPRESKTGSAGLWIDWKVEKL